MTKAFLITVLRFATAGRVRDHYGLVNVGGDGAFPAIHGAKA
jgi:hypothetical protein